MYHIRNALLAHLGEEAQEDRVYDGEHQMLVEIGIFKDIQHLFHLALHFGSLHSGEQPGPHKLWQRVNNVGCALTLDLEGLVSGRRHTTRTECIVRKQDCADGVQQQRQASRVQQSA